MTDSRVLNHAKLLVRYSLKTKKGQTVSVSGGTDAEPLIVAVYEELLRVGAFPVIKMVPSGLSEAFYRLGKEHHFTTFTPYTRAVVNNVDATIGIHSESNTRELTDVNPAKQAKFARAMKPAGDILRKKPWVLTLHPTKAYAQDAEMSLREFEEFVYSAVYADRKDPVAAWQQLKVRQDKLIRKLRGANEIRIVGPDTDIRMSVKGRKFINSDGRNNMPSGEIFTGPVETSVDGHIRYDFPICHAGREIEDVRLVFRKGRVVEASAAKNEKFLLKMIDIDKGARRIGELGIGTNRRIQRFTKNILFDEKIGGTIHLALGSSYPKTGGKNKSALHWDMIKDLRRGGTLYADGKVFMKDGRFR